ncbi:MAG: RsiV family protein [Weeksellaceae bacterium]|nr:RsiV family protein [Weeksellaceae bacterium]
MKWMTTFLLLFVSTLLAAQNGDYVILEGKIDKFKVTMELIQIGEFAPGEPSYVDSYYYNSQEIPLEVFQTVSDNAKDLALSTYVDEENIQETFIGNFQNGVYKGIWKKGNKSLPFELKIAPKGKYTEMVKLENSRRVPIDSGDSNEEIEGYFEYSFLVPKEEKLQRELAVKVYESYADFETFTRQSLDELEETYKNDIQNQWKEFGELRASFNHQLNESFSPFLNTTDHLIMRHFGYEYSGGAHGMSYQFFYNYDKRKNKWLAISDVLDVSKSDAINRVLDSVLREKFNLPAGVPLSQVESSIFLADEISFTSNFTLSKKGITFHYGLYEMTPYVYGFFELFVPYENLKPYLKNDFEF